MSEILMTRPFGPSIVKTKIPSKILNELNKYVDNTIEDKEKLVKLDHGAQLAGDVTQEFILEIEFMKQVGWAEFLGNVAQKYIEMSINKKFSTFKIEHSWIVRQFENEYNPTHWHNGHISGVGYLKVPDDLGKPRQKNKSTVANGRLQLIHGSRMFLSNSTFNIKPEVGDYICFQII